VVLRRPAVLPQLTRVEVYVSVDGDPVPDWRVRSAAEAEVIQGGQAERLVVTATRWDVANGRPLGAERVVGTLGAELHGRFLRLTVPLTALALDRSVPLAYYVVHRGLGEDWPAPASSDVVPDGAEGPAGPRYTLDPGRPGGWPDRWAMTLRPDAVVAVSLEAGASAEAGLLAVYPDNPLGLGEQTQLIPLAGPIAPPPWDVAAVYLPVARR
jgi:hypothetical protein